jgi:hypothetical protein
MHVQLSVANLLKMELQVTGSLPSVGMWKWEVNSGPLKEQYTLFPDGLSLQSLKPSTLSWSWAVVLLYSKSVNDCVKQWRGFDPALVFSPSFWLKESRSSVFQKKIFRPSSSLSSEQKPIRGLSDQANAAKSSSRSDTSPQSSLCWQLQKWTLD